ncbi:hypothetical protein RhiirA1_390784 [Rhizophagus irregularis]|uniref:Uncharacterized protein n=1 Tax=Rhizophagus irregularis TaxID=588596 RepID=A0A2N0S6F7_9GLOM|nr:hypothetical protein RhiirA1_390784 [Rhizophagus irregularis]
MRVFDDICVILDILKLIKEAILMLERTYTTLADCYLYLLRIATFFKQMPMNDYRSLKNSCIKAFNERYKEFDEDIYLLAFFLHPQYKGAGIHNTQFERIQKTALNIWKNLGYKKTSGLELKAQFRNKRSLNHIGNSISNDDVQKMIDNLFEEEDILNENEDEEEEYEEPSNIQKESVDEMLNIEQVIDLGP